MANFALEKATSYDVVAAYSTAQTILPAVGSTVTSGWFVLGAFAPHLTINGRLDVYASVSSSDLTLEVRLFELETNTALTASLASITETSATRKLGPMLTVVGSRAYQVQARCRSSEEAPDLDDFAVVHTVTISD